MPGPRKYYKFCLGLPHPQGLIFPLHKMGGWLGVFRWFVFLAGYVLFFLADFFLKKMEALVLSYHNEELYSVMSDRIQLHLPSSAYSVHLKCPVRSKMLISSAAIMTTLQIRGLRKRVLSVLPFRAFLEVPSNILPIPHWPELCPMATSLWKETEIRGPLVRHTAAPNNNRVCDYRGRRDRCWVGQLRSPPHSCLSWTIVLV